MSEGNCKSCGAPDVGLVCQFCGAQNAALTSEAEELVAVEELMRAFGRVGQAKTGIVSGLTVNLGMDKKTSQMVDLIDSCWMPHYPAPAKRLGFFLVQFCSGFGTMGRAQRLSESASNKINAIILQLNSNFPGCPEADELAAAKKKATYKGILKVAAPFVVIIVGFALMPLYMTSLFDFATNTADEDAAKLEQFVGQWERLDEDGSKVELTLTATGLSLSSQESLVFAHVDEANANSVRFRTDEVEVGESDWQSCEGGLTLLDEKLLIQISGDDPKCPMFSGNWVKGGTLKETVVTRSQSNTKRITREPKQDRPRVVENRAFSGMPDKMRGKWQSKKSGCDLQITKRKMMFSGCNYSSANQTLSITSVDEDDPLYTLTTSDGTEFTVSSEAKLLTIGDLYFAKGKYRKR